MVHKYHYECCKMTFTGEQTDDTIDSFSLLPSQRPVTPVNYKSTNQDIIKIHLPWFSIGVYWNTAANSGMQVFFRWCSLTVPEQYDHQRGKQR